LVGLLLLFCFFVPLALTLPAAELYNILAFHLTMAPSSIAPALIACVLWILVTAKISRASSARSLRRLSDETRSWPKNVENLSALATSQTSE
jgi:hypothetical protein